MCKKLPYILRLLFLGVKQKFYLYLVSIHESVKLFQMVYSIYHFIS